MTTIDISTPADAGFALAHCAECGMFLRPDEGCLHMKPVDDVARERADALAPEPSVPFNHAAGDTHA